MKIHLITPLILIINTYAMKINNLKNNTLAHGADIKDLQNKTLQEKLKQMMIADGNTYQENSSVNEGVN